MLFDGKGFGGGFGSLELGVDGITLFSIGIDGGFLGTFVGLLGFVVLLDGSEPCGVPFSLNSDLLGSDVLGLEVEVSFGVSGSDELHVLGKVDGTSSLGFLEGVQASEEAVVGEVGGLDGGGFSSSLFLVAYVRLFTATAQACLRESRGITLKQETLVLAVSFIRNVCSYAGRVIFAEHFTFLNSLHTLTSSSPTGEAAAAFADLLHLGNWCEGCGLDVDSLGSNGDGGNDGGL